MKTKWVEPTIEQRNAEYAAQRNGDVRFIHLVAKVARLPGETLREYVKRLKLYAQWGH
jgi:hypothetical protein